MAASLLFLKRRIKATNGISQIAKALETVAASKIKGAKKAVDNNRPYSEKISALVEDILSTLDTGDFSSPYVNRMPAAKKLVIAVSPDKGLCGPLTVNLHRELLELDPANTVIAAVGRKIGAFAANHGFDVTASFPMGIRLPEYSFIYPVLEIIRQNYFKGVVSEVALLFTEFRSFTVQKPVLKQLLPVKAVEGGTVKKIPYIFEPGRKEVLEELLPYYIEIKLYNALINAFTSEQASRMLAMHNARENALDMTYSLTLTYNKLRQEKITSEILDIAGGQVALL